VEEGNALDSGVLLIEVPCGFESTCNLNVIAGVVAWSKLWVKWHNVIEL